MLSPVETRVLELRRDVLLYESVINIPHKNIWCLEVTNVKFKHLGHKQYAAVGQSLVSLFLVHPEIHITTAVLVDQKVTKCRMV